MNEKYLRGPLRRSQANTLFEILKEFGLEPSQFRWEEFPSTGPVISEGAKLLHIGTDAYFSFDAGIVIDEWENQFEIFEVAYWPSDRISMQGSESDGKWDGVLQRFKRWAVLVKVDVLSPDLWDTVSQERKFSGVVDAEENSPFTLQEQNYITGRLREIESFLINTHALSAEHRKFVRGRLNYLEESSKRVGRKDWLSITYGVLLSTAVGIGLNGTQARELLQFAADVLSQILNHLHLLP